MDGRLYAVPGCAGARSVIYNKKVWAAAGITAPPITHDELLADLDKVRSANPAEDFSPLYLSGQDWYAGMQFVWDAPRSPPTPVAGERRDSSTRRPTGATTASRQWWRQ